MAHQAGPAMIKRVLPKHAAEIIFSATRIDAATAFRMGLVNLGCAGRPIV